MRKFLIIVATLGNIEQPLIKSATFGMPFPTITIVFHNLSGHNGHLFITELGKKFDSESIYVIAENKEKYTSFNVSIVDELKIPRSEEKIDRGNEIMAEGRMKVAAGKKLVKGSEGKEEMIAED